MDKGELLYFLVLISEVKYYSWHIYNVYMHIQYNNAYTICM